MDDERKISHNVQVTYIHQMYVLTVYHMHACTGTNRIQNIPGVVIFFNGADIAAPCVGR